jgi:hypothetical protein
MRVAWRREEMADGETAIVLTLHVQPGAKRTEVAGTHGDSLKIRLAAPRRRQGERGIAHVSGRGLRRAATQRDIGARRRVAGESRAHRSPEDATGRGMGMNVAAQ